MDEQIEELAQIILGIETQEEFDAFIHNARMLWETKAAAAAAFATNQQPPVKN